MFSVKPTVAKYYPLSIRQKKGFVLDNYVDWRFLLAHLATMQDIETSQTSVSVNFDELTLAEINAALSTLKRHFAGFTSP
ncbi:hypothetical protein EBB_10290 [Methylomonas sp. EbB]|uniref:Uncharacterized protein n=2 Tax=Methylomonas fluvii TaxID=1854564 RepID=A0ABR9DCW1_9GAMM|nr:hypothetical protein [Methylomonas fluvii]